MPPGYDGKDASPPCRPPMPQGRTDGFLHGFPSVIRTDSRASHARLAFGHPAPAVARCNFSLGVIPRSPAGDGACPLWPLAIHTRRCKLGRMKVDQGIFAKRNPQDDAESDRRAEADIAAGRYVEHAKVAEWLKTWGTAAERPVPPEWLE